MILSDLSSSRDKIFSLYGKTDSDIKGDLTILREWMKKQPHLPSDALSDNFLEIALLKSKLSVEKTKSKIENYCTLKGAVRYQYLFGSLPIPSEEPLYCAALPKLTDDFHRILLAKYRYEDYDMLNEVSASLYVREFLSRYDYNDGEILIYDLSGGSASNVTKFRVNVFADMLTILLKGHCARVQQVHVINRAATILLPIVTPLLPSKISSRIFFHDNHETLAKFIPTTHLPKEYGGSLKSLEDILGKTSIADWDNIHRTNSELLMEYRNTKSIEELRLEKSGTEEMQGTFKILNID